MYSGWSKYRDIEILRVGNFNAEKSIGRYKSTIKPVVWASGVTEVYEVRFIKNDFGDGKARRVD
jgi:hypothetical protein